MVTYRLGSVEAAQLAGSFYMIITLSSSILILQHSLSHPCL
ncbi:hypothetical protein Psal009_03609 (plasmid) [Piscirickettsia salmonis]|uniref:Uncharacterized protein n=1 Tax=Piscirickettsia salmonis TaxID=1238 RepID=A0A9Q6LP80_PISSA|nr:putative membrane protein [Piscirickettsia salmonis LF-89 = ATCC VR-1361]QGO07650.1 hypothetical protein Psal009_03609 [Piscirickettsia salmonis]